MASSFVIACEDPLGQLCHTNLPLSNLSSSHAVLGRHTECHISLGADETLSLRHLLASAWLDAVGEPQLRILDLGGAVKMRFDDDTQSAGFRANGPCAVSLGSCAIFMLLATGKQWPEDAEEAWESLGDLQIIERQQSRTETEFIRTVRPRLRVVRPNLASAMTGSKSDSTVVMQLKEPSELLTISADCPEAVGYLTLPGDRFVRLAPSDLARGVLIGRYERCELGASHFSDAETVSRVHLCLALDPTGLWAIDTCSTNGSWLEGEQIQAAKLGARAHLMLGGECLTWQMHQ
jgi:hypothetical protein